MCWSMSEIHQLHSSSVRLFSFFIPSTRTSYIFPLSDTGSSDLWLLSTSCTSSPAGCTTSSDPLPPLYPVNSTASTFTSANVPAILHYGDSNSGTFAHGIIGSDTATLAGLTSTSQYFAEIGETNTSVVQTGAAGLFGLGFPVNRFV